MIGSYIHIKAVKHTSKLLYRQRCRQQYIKLYQQRSFTSAILSNDFLSNLFSPTTKNEKEQVDGGAVNQIGSDASPLKLVNAPTVPQEKTRKKHNDFINSIVTKKIDFKRPAPHLWYPRAREMERKIIAHVGPTNSGKTYHAVNRLVAEEHMTGLYCAPLRLLAWETFESLNKQGCKTNLLTGQERDFPHEDARALCCTVEMAQTDYEFDIAIIDEIQMLGDFNRGAHWTKALLGIQAKEVHVCGELRTIGLLEKICRETNEELIVHRYDRLSELDYESEEVLSDLKNLRAGDCIVGFKRKDLFRLKNSVERATQKKCCMIYGALPPPIRKSQATLFNTPNNDYDVLVATDAVGMGLNLSIGRVIFESMEKFDGIKQRKLEQHEVKQIGGRAGRFKSNFPIGYVTTRHEDDREFLTEMMAVDANDMEFAYTAPSLENISEFAELISRIELQIPTSFLNVDKTQFLVNKYGPDYFNAIVMDKYTNITISSFNEVVAIALEELCNTCFVGNSMAKANTKTQQKGRGTRNSLANGITVKLPSERTHRINEVVLNELRKETNCTVQCLNWDNVSLQQLLLNGNLDEVKLMFSKITDLIVTPNDTFLQSDIDLSRCDLSSLLPYYSKCIEIDSKDQAYKFGDFQEKVDVSFHLNDIRMPLELRHLLLAAPVKANEPKAVKHFKNMVLTLLRNEKVRLNIDVVPNSVPRDAWMVRELEITFSMIDVYLWLSLRFPDDFIERDLAMEQAEVATRNITKYLNKRAKKYGGDNFLGKGNNNRQKKFHAKNFINQHDRKGSGQRNNNRRKKRNAGYKK
jgi:hypothetical protein